MVLICQQSDVYHEAGEKPKTKQGFLSIKNKGRKGLEQTPKISINSVWLTHNQNFIKGVGSVRVF